MKPARWNHENEHFGGVSDFLEAIFFLYFGEVREGSRLRKGVNEMQFVNGKLTKEEKLRR